jgi:hypothetical protein
MINHELSGDSAYLSQLLAYAAAFAKEMLRQIRSERFFMLQLQEVT